MCFLKVGGGAGLDPGPYTCDLPQMLGWLPGLDAGPVAPSLVLSLTLAQVALAIKRNVSYFTVKK
jgi:hypothetical protein